MLDGNYVSFLNWWSCRFWSYVRDIVGAAAYLDSRGAVHRDIKADNILIDGEDNAKLSDFGLAKKVRALSSR